MKIEVGERGAGKKSGERGGEKRLKGGEREGKGVREGGVGGSGELRLYPRTHFRRHETHIKRAQWHCLALSLHFLVYVSAGGERRGGRGREEKKSKREGGERTVGRRVLMMKWKMKNERNENDAEY